MVSAKFKSFKLYTIWGQKLFTLKKLLSK